MTLPWAGQIIRVSNFRNISAKSVTSIVRIPEREVEDQASFRGCRRLKQFMAEQDAFCRVVMRERESVGNEQGLVSVIIRPMTRW